MPFSEETWHEAIFLICRKLDVGVNETEREKLLIELKKLVEEREKWRDCMGRLNAYDSPKE